jgi:hypothetical protein
VLSIRVIQRNVKQIGQFPLHELRSAADSSIAFLRKHPSFSLIIPYPCVALSRRWHACQTASRERYTPKMWHKLHVRGSPFPPTVSS